MVIPIEQIKNQFQKSLKSIDPFKDAKKILKQKDKIRLLLIFLNEDTVRIIFDFISMLQDFLNGKYKKFPKRTIISIIAALLYFLNLTDVIPDVILVLGFTDDIAVIEFVYESIKNDLKEYMKWKNKLSTVKS